MDVRVCMSCGHVNPPGAEVCEVCSAPLERRVEKTVALPEGTVLRNKYTIVKLLGHGGFGLTYLVQDTVLLARRVLKELFPEGSRRDGFRVVLPRDLRDERFVDLKVRFLREAQVLARFNYPYIPKVFEYFEDNGTVYYVMEFVEGDSLAKLFQQHTVFNVPRALRLTLEILDVLEVLHEEGFLHMDIKPDNILLPPKVNHAVLIDFGSAVEYEKGEKPGTVTPGYSPPEQAGVLDAPLGPWSDLYAVGATLYHMLTGQVPPSATDRKMGVDLLSPRELNPRIPEGVSDLVMRFLAMEPQERFRRVNEAREAIEDLGLVEGDRTATPPTRRRGDSVLERIRMRREARKVQREEHRSVRQARPSPTVSPTVEPAGKSPYQFVITHRVERARVMPTAFAHADSHVFVLWSDHTGRLYRVHELLEERFVHLAHKTLPTAVVFSQKKGWFATGEASGVIRVWSTASFQHHITLKGHPGWISSLGVGLEPQHLISGDSRGQVILWDLESKKVQFNERLGISWILVAEMLSPRILLVADARGKVALVDIRRRERVHELQVQGTFISAGVHRLTMKLHMGTTRGEIVTVDLHDLQEVGRFQAHVSPVRAVVTFPEIPVWCSVDDEGTCKVWEGNTEVGVIPRAVEQPLGVAASGKGALLVLTAGGQLIRGMLKGPHFPSSGEVAKT